MIQCSNGWFLVGADVDSQEQWIAALFGDSAHESRRAGATPFSNMLLAGDKAKFTDLHSVVAKEVGISRDQAKASILTFDPNWKFIFFYYVDFKLCPSIRVRSFTCRAIFKATGNQRKNCQGIIKETFWKNSRQRRHVCRNKKSMIVLHWIFRFYRITDIGVKLLTRYFSECNMRIEDYYMFVDGKHFVRKDICKEFNGWLERTRNNTISKPIFASRAPLKLYRGGL